MSTLIQPPANFPVTWKDPAYATHLWIFDQMHAPEPETPADAIYYRCAYDHGITAAARALSLPLRTITQRINTYSYFTLVPLEVPSEEAAALGALAEQQMTAAMDHLKEQWNNEYLPEIKSHLADWETWDIAAAENAQLLSWIDESIERTKRLYEIHFLVILPVLCAISQFDDFYRELLGESRTFDAYRLLQGFDNMTVQGGRVLWQLSRQALATPAVAEILQNSHPSNVLGELQNRTDAREFLSNLQAYLDSWGRRGDRWGWSYPSWIEDPSPVIKNLQHYMAQPARDLVLEMAAQAAEREQLVAQARAQIRTHTEAAVRTFEFLLKAAQEAIVLTEDHGYWIDFQCMYFVRRLFLEHGRRFVRAGVLDQEEDVVLLTPVEIRETAEQLPRLDRRATVAGRRAEMEYFRAISAPPMLGTLASGPQSDDPVTIALGKFFGPPPRPTDEAGVVYGNSGSPGKVRGPACVIRSLQQASKLRPGDVLVAETTAPPWTPLFATAAAIVADTGGILSHCAVVAREYGIPAVVGTGKATSVFRDGDLIEVDGDMGRVRRI